MLSRRLDIVGEQQRSPTEKGGRDMIHVQALKVFAMHESRWFLEGFTVFNY